MQVRFMVRWQPASLLLFAITCAVSHPATATETSKFIDDKGRVLEAAPAGKTAPQVADGDYIVLHKAEPIIRALARSQTRTMPRPASQLAAVQRATAAQARMGIVSERLDLEGLLRRHGFDPHRIIKRRSEKVLSSTTLQGLSKEAAQALLRDGLDVRPVKLIPMALVKSIPFVKADQAWSTVDGAGMPVTGRGITVGVIDSGIDYTHPAFGACTQAQFMANTCPRVRGINYLNASAPAWDDNKHGTHVAGTIAGQGTAPGVAPDATIVALKVCSSSGSCNEAAIIDALEYAADPDGNDDTSDHLDVVNLSLGGSGDPDDALSQAVDAVVLAGVVAVVAAGNDGPDLYTVGSPGAARSAITVGALDELPWFASNVVYFSSRGPVSWNAGHTLLKPDIVAPGSGICAPRASVSSAAECATGYTSLSGTSMATPHVAGAAALILQAHPTWSPRQVKHALLGTAHQLLSGSITRPLVDQGQGSLDALAAVQLSHDPLIAEITNTAPLSGGPVTFTGSALGPGFLDYNVSYRLGASQPWILLVSGNEPVDDGPLGTVDSGMLASGLAEFKLTVTSTYGSRDAYGVLRVGNTEITYPYDWNSGRNSIGTHSLAAADPIPIEGSASATLFNSYTLELCDQSGANCTSQGFRDVTSGAPVRSGTLGRLAPLDIPGFTSGAYTIKLTTIRSDATRDVVTALVYIDTDLKSGYPALYPKAYINSSYYVSLLEQPVLDDINGDSLPEMIFNYGNKVEVRDSRFDIVSSYTLPITQAQVPATVADLDGDGDKEIVVVDISSSLMWAIERNGTRMPGFPRSSLASAVPWKPHLSGPRVTVDLNDDGKAEILTPDLRAENWLGAQPAGWDPAGPSLSPHELSTGWSYGAAVGDINNDGRIEIVAATHQSPESLHAFSNAGEVLWSVAFPGPSPSEPTLVDLDADGQLETVVVDAGNPQNVYAYASNGHLQWQVSLPVDGRNSDIFRTSPLSAGDLNLDGTPEVIVAGNSCFHIISASGALRMVCPPGCTVGGVIQIGNIDADPEPEIIPSFGGCSASRVGMNWIYTWGAFNADGSFAGGFPRRIPGLYYSDQIHVADIDGDGKNEILTMRGEHMYVWKTEGCAPEGWEDWPQQTANAAHTRAHHAANRNRCVTQDFWPTPETPAITPTVAMTITPPQVFTSTPVPAPPTATVIPTGTGGSGASTATPTPLMTCTPTLTNSAASTPTPPYTVSPSPTARRTPAVSPTATRTRVAVQLRVLSELEQTQFPSTGGRASLSVRVSAWPGSKVGKVGGFADVKERVLGGMGRLRRAGLEMIARNDTTAWYKASWRVPANRNRFRRRHLITLVITVAGEQRMRKALGDIIVLAAHTR